MKWLWTAHRLRYLALCYYVMFMYTPRSIAFGEFWHKYVIYYYISITLIAFNNFPKKKRHWFGKQKFLTTNIFGTCNVSSQENSNSNRDYFCNQMWERVWQIQSILQQTFTKDFSATSTENKKKKTIPMHSKWVHSVHSIQTAK